MGEIHLASRTFDFGSLPDSEPILLTNFATMFDPPYSRAVVAHWARKGLKSISGKQVKLKTARGSTRGMTTTPAWFWEFMQQLND